MGRRRRATDSPPLSDIVSKGNLDDRLETVSERQRGHERLADERMQAHGAVHEQVAESLRDYKKDANEWRATLTDLRTTFLPKGEYQAEHRALQSQLHSEITTEAGRITSMDGRLDIIEKQIQTITDREVTTRGVLSSGRNVIVLGFTIMGGIVTLLVFLNPRV